MEPLYRHWAETNQSVFYNEDETVAVGDHMVVSRWSAISRRWARISPRPVRTPIPTRCTCSEGRVAMVWPYDERGRLIGENVWEYDEIRARSDQARSGGRPDHRAGRGTARALIKPLPPFDDSLLAG